MFLVPGVVALVSVAVFGVAALRTRRKDQQLPPDERAAARASRYEAARDRRPAWTDNPWWGVILLLIAAYRGWLALAAVLRGVLWLAALDALLCLLALWSGANILRRRRPRPGR